MARNRFQRKEFRSKGRLWDYGIIQNFSDDTYISSVTIKYIIPSLVSIVVGVILGYFLDVDLSTNPQLWMIRSVSIIGACIITIAICVLAAILRLLAVEEARNMYRVTISKDHPNLTVGRSTAFDFCSAVAKQAKHSIYVVGPHFTNQQLNPGTETHSKYLSDEMSAAILRHTYNYQESDAFEYFRIIQLDPPIKNSFNEDGCIEWNAMGNAALAEHVQTVLTTNRGSEFVNVNIYARTFIPSLPSILVIDDQYVFFSLPTYLTRHQEGDTNILDREPSLNYDFVFEIEDKSGVIPKQFKRLITQLCVSSRRIQSVGNKPDSDQVD